MRFANRRAVITGGASGIGEAIAKTNVTVNCVNPAAVQTPIIDQVPQSFIDFMLSKIPMDRFGAVDEVASLVCWLASEECPFSCGAVPDISGSGATY